MKNIVTETADKYGIKWDYDSAFMSLSLQVVGKEHISDMNPSEMDNMASFIEENQHLFSKKILKESLLKDVQPLKQNEDYGDFLEKVRARLKKRKAKRDRNRQKS